MSKEQKITEDYLRLGQIVRIHGHKCLQATQPGKEEIRGMITVKGFTDKDAKYTTFEFFKNCEFYRQSLFQILPRGQFDGSDDEAKKAKEYADLVKSKAGDYIKFGEDVIFKHVDSHDYLSGSVRCSDGGMGAFKVQLSNVLSQDLIFKLQPFRSFEKEGDKIKLQSPLRIKNISNRCYISTEKNNFDKYNIVTTYSKDFTWLIHLHEIHSTLEDMSEIRTHDLLYLMHTNNEGQNEGYLTLEKDKNSNNQTAMIPFIKEPLELTGFPFYTSLWEIEKLPVNRISPINETEVATGRGTEGTYTLRQLLDNSYLEVSQIQAEGVLGEDNIDPYELTIKSAKGLPNISEYMRHMGLIKIGGPKATADIEIDEGQLVEQDLDSLTLRNSHPFRITRVKVSDFESRHAFRIMKLDEQSKSEVLFILSTYEALDNFQQVLTNSTQQFEKKVKSKQLNYIDLTLQKLIAFIKQCSMQDLEGELLPVKKLQFICMDLKICDKLFKILESIGTKILQEIYKSDMGENNALKQVFNRAYYLVWQIIKNNPITKIYVCEDWLQIILDHAIQLEEDTVHDTLNQILTNNDVVVTKFLKAKNNKLVQSIIGVFALKPPHKKFLNIFSASCVSGNLPIVGNQTLILSEFLRQLDEMSTFKFLYDLDIEQVAQPQEGQELKPIQPKIKTVYIECYISKDHKGIRGLKDFFEDSGRIDLHQTSDYFIAYLNLLADICYGKNTQARTHIQEKLKPQKNQAQVGSQEIVLLQEPSILDILVAILQDKQMNQQNVEGNINLQKAVLRLITFAYIESADQNPVLRINRYRNLDNMISAVLQPQPKFFNIMEFIKQELKNFKSFFNSAQTFKAKEKQPTNPADIKRREKEKEIHSLQVKNRLYTILDLLKSTLINGFWTIKDQQSQILPLLLNILKNNKNDILHQKEQVDNPEELKKEFINFKAQVSFLTPGVQKIISCKALACQLIEIIFDFRFNSLVTQTVQFYKDLDNQDVQKLTRVHMIDLDLTTMKSDGSPFMLYNPVNWQKRITSISNTDDPEYEKLKEAISFLIPLMVELSIHRDSRLFFRSLKILRRHFYSNPDIKNLMLKLSLYDNQGGGYLANIVNDKRKILNKLEEESLLYAKLLQENPYKSIMDFLAWLSEALKVGTDLQAHVESSHYHSIFEHFNEGSRIDKFHQGLIKNNDLHPILLKFLGLSKQSLQTFSDNAKEVLKYVYRFLTLLARNYKEGKVEMIHMLDKIKTHVKEQAYAIRSMYMNRQNEIGSDFKFLSTTNYARIGISLRDQESLNILKRRNDCEAILLLAELFTDNKDYLFNQNLMESITVEIAQIVDKVPIQNYYKAHLLNFFRSMIYYKDKHIISNQSRILAKLQDSQKKDIYYRFDISENNVNGLKDKKIEDLIREWEIQNETLMNIAKPKEPWPLRSSQSQPIIILQELSYFITMMNLFSNLVEGQQTVNIGKCRQVHSYTMLMNVLTNSSLCYPLKAHLRNYINELYYSTAIQEDLAIQIINLQIPLLIQDLNTLLVVLSKERIGRYYILHPIRYKYFESYIYLYIEQIVYSVNYILNDNTFMNEIMKQLNQNYGRGLYYLHYYIIRVYERLRWLVNYYYQHKYLRGFLNVITNKMKQKFLIYFKANHFIVFDKSEEKLHGPETINSTNPPKKKAMNQERQKALKKRSKKLMHKLVEAGIGNYFTDQRPEKGKNFPLVFFLPYDQDGQAPVETQNKSQKNSLQRKIAQKLKTMLFEPEDKKKRVDYHSIKMGKLNNALHGQDSFNLFMKRFIEKECNQLYVVDSFSQTYYKFQNATFVSFKEYIQVFVEVNTKNPLQIPNELKIFFFETLLQHIMRHSENKLLPIESWGKEQFEAAKDKIRDSQNFLKEANVAQLLTQTLKHTENFQLILSILQFGIGYLVGGNTECQNSILVRVKQDPNNDLFLKIQRIISKLGKKISSKIAYKTALVIPRADQFVVQALDRYDYYQKSSKALKRFNKFQDEFDDMVEENIQKQVFRCLFKFMQLLCECNNISFKNFIREQTDLEEKKKNTSFNILNMTTFEVRRLFKVMNEEASIIILPLTDFLNEVVALPVSKNQLSLCQTTFFEDLCYMAGFFNEIANLKARSFDIADSKDRLFSLYQKCILVILNILEGNSLQLNRSFLNKLEVKFLLRLLLEYFEKLGIKTEKDLADMTVDPANEIVHENLQAAISVMVVLLKLQQSPGAEAFIQKKENFLTEIQVTKGIPFKQLCQGLQKLILKVEINSTLDKQLAYFPNHPILTKLSGTTRDRIMQEVSRSTQREKIKSLLKFKDQINMEIAHNFRIEKQKFLGIQITSANILKLQDYSFKLGYAIIGTWSFTTDVIIEFGEVQYTSPAYVVPILLCLNLLQLGITLVYAILYYKYKYVLADYRSKQKKQQEQSDRLRSEGLKQNSGKTEVEKKGILYTLGKAGSWVSQKINNNPLVIFAGNDQKFGNVMMFVLTSLLGTFYDPKLFMLYILYYFMQNATLQNVFKAITFNLNQLFSVSMLGIVFVYIFCLIFYQTYSLDIFASKDPNDNCDTIVGCILDLYVSGTIGGSVQQLKVTRFTTDLIYFVFFDLLFSNIVSGIMIDTFSELRSRRQEMDDDKKNKCYICGRSRAQLQKDNQKFDVHIKDKHFLWNYIYYLYCLGIKNQTQYTGLEYQIRVCIDSGENEEDYIKWIPFGGQQSDPNMDKVIQLNRFMENLNIDTKKRISSLGKEKSGKGQEQQGS